MDVGSIAMTEPVGSPPGAHSTGPQSTGPHSTGPHSTGARTPALSSVRTLRQAAVLFFHHDSPRLLAAHLLVLVALRASHGGFGLGDLLVILGVAIYWPLQEWVLHIYVLHMQPFTWRGRRVDTLMAQVHRAHHREPWSLDFVFLPVKVLLALIPVNALVWWLAMPTLGVALTGMMAMAAAALAYEWVHYLTHTPYRPRSRYYRAIWRGHRLHHFKNERYWHGFTVPLVDTLLGTNPDPRGVETSPTCRDLERRG